MCIRDRLERSWCLPRALSGLARDFRTWQAVVAVGVEVHLWRMEVRLRRPLLVRAQPRPASLERAAPDFAAEMLAVVRGPPLAPAPTFDAPMFDSPLQSAARPIASTSAITAEVADVFSATACSILDYFVLFSWLPGLLPVDARQCGAARRRPVRLRRCSSAAAMSARLGRAARASPASQATLRSSSTPHVATPRAAENLHVSAHFFLVSISACVAGVRSWIELTASFPTV